MKRIPLILAAFLLPFCIALAQDKPQPPPKKFTPETRQASDVLPALNLPEYVITGSDMISFTEDRKSQLGDPDSREFTARVGRGEREDRFFDTSPTRMPLRKPVLTGSDENVLFKAGYGSFRTPHLQLWYGDRYRLGDAAAHVLYESSDGHVAHSDYSHFGFDISGGTYLPSTLHPLLASSRLEAEFHADIRDYGLYADKLERTLPAPDFRRNLSNLNGRIGLVSRKNRWLDHEVSVFISNTQLEEEFGLRDTMQIDEYRAIETRMGLDAAARFHTAGLPIHSHLAMHVNDLNDSDEDARRPYFVEAGGRSHYQLSDKLWLDGGLSLYLFRGSDHASQFRFYPSITLRYLQSASWTFHTGYVPEVREQSFDAFRTLNPYLMLASEIRHTDIPLRLEAGAAFDDRKSSSARILLSYTASPSWGRFSLLPDPVRQQWDLQYNSWSSIGEIQGDLAHSFSARTRLQGRALFRISGSDEFDGSIPYLPDYEIRLLLRHAFPFDLSLQTTMQLVGQRQAESTSDLAAWMMLGVELEYQFYEHAGAFLRFDNLLDQNYQMWTSYRERPFFLMGGVIIRF